MTLTGFSNLAITALNSTDFILSGNFYDNNTLTVFRFDGVNFTKIGTSLYFSSLEHPALTALNSTDFVLAVTLEETLTAFRIDRHLDIFPGPHSPAGGAF